MTDEQQISAHNFLLRKRRSAREKRDSEPIGLVMNNFHTIRPPTLVVWCENDSFVTKQGALAYSNDIKNIHYKFYPTGHFALEEYHKSIARETDLFLLGN